MELKKAYVSGRTGVYNILIEFGVTIKLVKLMEMCLNESIQGPGRQIFPVKNGLKQGDALSALLTTLI